MAYQSDESGRSEIWVVPFPGLVGKRQVSVSGGTLPHWSANGRELFFLNSDTLLSMRINPGGPSAWGTPQFLFTRTSLARYAVTADGQQFIVSLSDSPVGRATEIRVVLNFFEERGGAARRVVEPPRMPA